MKKLLIAVDYNGTWSTAPKFFTAFGKALMKAGHKVVVLTGSDNASKALKDDGYKKGYDEVEVVDGKDAQALAEAKAKWLARHDADLFIDNDGLNVTTASTVTDCAQFIPEIKEPEKK